MLSNLKEWISDNLRYLILGAVVLVVLIGIISIVKLVSGGGEDKKNYVEQSTEQTTQKTQEAETETEAEADVTLTTDQADILELMTEYYNAKTEKDVETLKRINPSFSAEDEADLNQTIIESYQNVKVYSVDGPEKDSYLVYVYMDAKVSGIDTLAPVLSYEYLTRGEDGNLMIADKFASKTLTDFVEKMNASKSVQKLIKQVDQKLAEATAADEQLKSYVNSMQGGQGTEDAGQDEGDEAAAGTLKENTEVQANTTVNVRGTASADGVLYGVLPEGTQAKVIQADNGGWSKIQYVVNGTTIEGYVMTQYLTEIQ